MANHDDDLELKKLLSHQIEVFAIALLTMH
jgi:hypothetical protein